MRKNLRTKLKGKRILLTGGTGFIGSWITSELVNDNAITLLDNGRRNAFSLLPKNIQSAVEFVKADIRDGSVIKKLAKKADVVFHLAAIAGASSYEKDPLLTLDVNLFGTRNVLDAALLAHVEYVYLFSTSEVYGRHAVHNEESGDTTIGPLSESRWSYAISKLASDHLAMAFHKVHNLPVVIVRPFNVYGPLQVGEGAIVSMLQGAVADREITVHGTGEQKRSWCFVSDLVHALLRLYDYSIVGECINIGNPSAYLSIQSLARKIQGLVPGSKIINTEGKPVEIIDRVPNIDKVKSLINFHPDVSIDDGLKLTYNWIVQTHFKQ